MCGPLSSLDFLKVFSFTGLESLTLFGNLELQHSHSESIFVLQVISLLS